MSTRIKTLVAAIAFAGGSAASALAHRPASPIVGGEFAYVVQAGDTWALLGARYGVSPVVLAALNGQSPAQRVKTGDAVRVDNRHLVPGALADGITINVPQRLLFVVRDGAVVAHYPVGLGRPTWPTFVGSFVVATKETDPVWDVPLSIQEEMRRQGKAVLTRVGPGPANPLGQHWLGLSLPGYGIHGTTTPLSIYTFQSHGCVRLHPDDIAALFEQAHVGMTGQTIYEPVLLHATGDDILLEAHPDVYRRAPNAFDRVAAEAWELGVEDLIDWTAVAHVLGVRNGQPHPVRLPDAHASGGTP